MLGAWPSVLAGLHSSTLFAAFRSLSPTTATDLRTQHGVEISMSNDDPGDPGSNPHAAKKLTG